MKKGRRPLFLLGVVGLFHFCTVSAVQPEIDITVEKFVLDNGLTVLVHPDHKAPIVAVGVWYHVGSKDEPEGKIGFAHLFEHLMFEGSEHYPQGFAGPLEEVGATDLNGTTNLDRTNYFETVPTPALDLALWLESDRMGHLLGALNQEKLDQERAAVLNEKRQNDNQPYGRAYYRTLEALFPVGHPYRHPTSGSIADLGAASLDDVKQWFRDFYGAANAVLVLAGDIEPERGRSLAEKYFGDIPPGPPLTRLKSWVPERSQDIHETMYDRVPGVRSYRIWAVPGWISRDRLLLEIAASILGDGKNSRLYQALVYELRHAVDVSVHLQPFELASLFSIDTTLSSGTTIAQVNDIIDQEFKVFLQDGPGEEELARAKMRINAGLLKGLEQIGGFSGKATILAQGELYDGNPEFFRTALSWINHATALDVREAARRWLSGGLYQLDVLPFHDYQVSQASVDRSAGPPEVSGLPEPRFPEVQRAELSNGLPVVLAERPESPVVALSIQFDVGFSADFGLKQGTASFTLAMMRESTGNSTALEVEERTELLGAEWSSSADLDTSSITLSAISGNLRPSIELFADVIRNPAFTPHEMERVRVRMLAAIEHEKNQPVSLALRTLPPLLYGDGHPYGVPFTGSGTEESIRQLQRDDLLAFYRNGLRPDNATLFIVGATTMDEIMPVLEDSFGQWQPPRGSPPQMEIAEVPATERARVIVIDRPDSQQSLILGGLLAPATGVPNNLDILMMNDVIGGTYAARVYQNLRVDRNWSYGAFTLMRDARGQRPWIVYAPVQSEHTADAINELIGEFNRFLESKPATAEELTRVFNSTVYSLPGRFETSTSVLDILQANERFGRPDDYVSRLKKEFEAVDLQRIHSAARQVLHPDRITWVVVGDRTQIEQGLRNLGVAELEFMDSNGRIIE